MYSLNFTVLVITICQFRTGKGHFLLLYQIIAIRELHFFYTLFIFLFFRNYFPLISEHVPTSCVTGDFMCMPVSHK